ncbi:MAG: restriction endonuclease subunit S [Alphaproteobacteria bacterium]|nr:restriction endonuclease subunit S [Alphaproteobacteria bacterium]MDA8013134.1 restriction endonuclease subunit S [Alphaproteobacteria bacterium]
MWESAELGEVAEVVTGGTPKSGVDAYWDGDICWITPKDMGQNQNLYVSATSRRITESGLNNSAAKLVPPNSVILSARAPIGHLAINSVPMAFSQGCKGLVPSPDLDAEFLYYFLLFNKGALDEMGTGTTFKELSSARIKNIEIPFPPLAEQRRVVSILNEAFSGTDRLRALSEKNTEDLKELRWSVLQKHLAPPLQHQEGAVMWASAELGKVCEIHSGRRPRGGAVSDGVLSIGGEHINSDGSFNLSNPKYIPGDFFHRLKRGKIEVGDVLVVKDGATTGKVGFFNEDAPFEIGAVNEHVFILRSRNRENLVPSYLYWLLTSKEGNAEILKHKTGAAQGGINLSIRGIEISFPPLDEQRRIVSILDEVNSKIDKLLVLEQNKARCLDELKQSILQKAFTGELTQEKAEAE